MDNSPTKTPVGRLSTLGPPPSLAFPTFSLEEKDELSQIIPLRRSTSSKRSAIYFSPGPDLTPVPQLPPTAAGFQITPQTSTSSFLPVSDESTRPSSANSVSSVGSLPSPLFGQELDAFPSVPVTTPTTPIGRRKLTHPEMNFATPATASFDTALLSSAIHLTSTHKQATPKASFKPLPSEMGPTSTSRPSGEMVR